MARRKSHIKKDSKIFESKQIIDDTNIENFNFSELYYLASEYAIMCLNEQYKGSFERWYNILESNWRKIANKNICLSDDTYNTDETRHLAINFAITCLNGNRKSFEKWYNTISPNWKEIANMDKNRFNE